METEINYNIAFFILFILGVGFGYILNMFLIQMKRLTVIKSSCFDIKNEEIEDLAFENSIDYKPWETNLDPNEYYSEGFKVGYMRAVTVLKKEFNKIPI